MKKSKRRFSYAMDEKFMKNPGKKHAEARKEYFSSMRGERIPGMKVVGDKRRKERDKRYRKEMMDW